MGRRKKRSDDETISNSTWGFYLLPNWLTGEWLICFPVCILAWPQNSFFVIDTQILSNKGEKNLQEFSHILKADYLPVYWGGDKERWHIKQFIK